MKKLNYKENTTAPRQYNNFLPIFALVAVLFFLCGTNISKAQERTSLQKAQEILYGVGSEQGELVSNAEYGYWFSIPSGWEQISNAELQKIEQLTGRQFASGTYILRPVISRVPSPLITIETNLGSINSVKELEENINSATYRADLQKGFEDGFGSIQGAISSNLSEVSYRAEKPLLSIEGRLKTESGEFVYASRTIFGKNTHTKIYLVMSTDLLNNTLYDTYKEKMRGEVSATEALYEVVNSFTYDPEHAFSEKNWWNRFLESVFSKYILVPFVAFGVVGVVIGLVEMSVRRTSKPRKVK